MRGVKNGPSPEWLQKRLIAIGLRPINALVDITNFMTFDRGRPLHVFDAAKVHGNLTVRRGSKARACSRSTGAPISSTRASASSPTRRAWSRSPASWAARNSGCDANTTDVLIEFGAVGSAQHRPNRAQARHQFGRALSLRARRRSELHGAGPGAGDADGARFLRRHAVGDHRRGFGACGGSRDRFPGRRGEAPLRPRRAAHRNEARARSISASSLPARARP